MMRTPARRAGRSAGPTVHVAIVLSLAFGAAGRRGRLLGRRRGARRSSRSPNDAAVIAAARTVPRGTIMDRTGKVLADNKKDANGEFYRVYAGRAISQVVGYASRRLRAGRARARVRRRAGRAGRRSGRRDAFAKFGADPYDPKDLTLSLSYDLQRAAVAALGKRRGAVVMLDPTTGEVLALASTPTYDASAIADPATAEGHLRGAPGRPGPATPAARDARALRAGLGLQDRDRGGRPRVRGDHAGRRRTSSSRPPRRTASSSTASASATAITRRPARRRSTSSGRPRSRATSTTR